VQLAEGDLRRWRPARTRYRIVLANVFSEILRGAAVPIARSVARGGCLLLSGILRPQEQEVLSSFIPLGFVLEKTARRGKWVTLKLRVA
jgi:ribosomal protein L11 methyltransferase